MGAFKRVLDVLLFFVGEFALQLVLVAGLLLVPTALVLCGIW